MTRYHLDTDFVVYALSSPGPERRRLRALADSDAEIQMSAVAWYEFSRGPRTPEQLAVGRVLLGEEGVVAFSEAVAAQAAEVFRRLGSPRRKAADVAIGVTAALHDAVLITRNARDFAGVPGLTVEAIAPRKP
ncbi:MAG TPA: PIN domain-containing protein [Vicinamibacteria bacterium]|nr:PIN domain-containing protein [Vicinamibacteria bacterium]